MKDTSSSLYIYLPVLLQVIDGWWPIVEHDAAPLEEDELSLLLHRWTMGRLGRQASAAVHHRSTLAQRGAHIGAEVGADAGKGGVRMGGVAGRVVERRNKERSSATASPGPGPKQFLPASLGPSRHTGEIRQGLAHGLSQSAHLGIKQPRDATSHYVAHVVPAPHSSISGTWDEDQRQDQTHKWGELLNHDQRLDQWVDANLSRLSLEAKAINSRTTCPCAHLERQSTGSLFSAGQRLPRVPHQDWVHGCRR